MGYCFSEYSNLSLFHYFKLSDYESSSIPTVAYFLSPLSSIETHFRDLS